MAEDRSIASAPDAIKLVIARWIMKEETDEIYRQLKEKCIRNRQVLWSGMLREVAQKWADAHNFQTLTTAMGPLMDTNDPKCPKNRKTPAQWSRYVHGASVIFAWYITQGDLATVLSQPPPQRFHPSGLSSYQTIEEPILKGQLGNRAVGKIVVVHPTVGKAADFTYELWPHDELSLWTISFGVPEIVRYWRQVKALKGKSSVQLDNWTSTGGSPIFAKAKIEVAVADGSSCKSKKKKKRKKGQCSVGKDKTASNGQGGVGTTDGSCTVAKVKIEAASSKSGKKKRKKGQHSGGTENTASKGQEGARGEGSEDAQGSGAKRKNNKSLDGKKGGQAGKPRKPSPISTKGNGTKKKDVRPEKENVRTTEEESSRTGRVATKKKKKKKKKNGRMSSELAKSEAQEVQIRRIL